MPELPDISAYINALTHLIKGEPLRQLRIASPFLLRTVEPSPEDCQGRRVVDIRRLGKRIAIGLEDEYWMVIHLMIAGRLHWRKEGSKLGGKQNLAAFDFPQGTLVLTEAGSARRASLHLLKGKEALLALDPGGIDVLAADVNEFRKQLLQENRTLKRALTDPRILSGIGNAYSDEILHAAKLSPIARTKDLSNEQWERLLEKCKQVLQMWTEKLCAEAEKKFPEGVTAFRPEMAVHGKFGQACPVCGETVQRIRYADNETNYCPQCQTGGKLLADRSLSRVLKSDWPRTLAELEALKKK